MSIQELLEIHNRPWTTEQICIFAMLFSIILAWCIYRIRHHRIRIYQAIGLLVLVSYLAFIFGITVFTREPGVREAQTELFWSWKEIFVIGQCGRLGSEYPRFLLQENALNILMLFPVGFLLPIARGRRVSWKVGLFAGVLISGTIEVLQFVLRRGLFEWDDIIHNSLGCMIGCIIGGYVLWAIRRWMRE